MSAGAVTGVGVDVVEIARFDELLHRRPALAARLFTAAEIEYAAGRPRPAQHLAARFCAKEAVVKALRPQRWDWRDIVVLPESRVLLLGPLADRGPVSVSLTHAESVAAAIAIAG